MKKVSIVLGVFTMISFLLFIAFATSNVKMFAQKETNELAASKNNKNLVEKITEAKAFIKGKVFYPDSSRTASDAVILFYKNDLREEPSNERIPTTLSGDGGLYEKELTPGAYTICAAKQTENHLIAQYLYFGLPVGGKCAETAVKAGENKTIDLKLAQKANSLEGKILDWKSVFVPRDITVVLYRPLKLEKDKWVLTTMDEATLDAKAEVKPDEEGNFIINGLPEGTYFLRLEIPNQPTWFYKGKGLANDATPIQIKNKSENKISFSYY